MDPEEIGVFVASVIALTIEAILKDQSTEAVRDSYNAVRDAIAKWDADSVRSLEESPRSPARRAHLTEIVENQSAEDKQNLLLLLEQLVSTLRQLPEMRVEIDRLTASSIRLDPIRSAGGIRVTEIRAGGNIIIGGNIGAVGGDIVGGDKILETSANLDKCEYRVWFGTNRRPNDRHDASKGYSSERDGAVHYGHCQVYIPRAHKIGSVGSPWWKRISTWTDDRLKVTGLEELDRTLFWSQVKRQLAHVNVAERQAVIFIHGYNVSFNDAALRAAQIGFDLSIQGAMAFFSWPSRGTLQGYMADEATIEASEGDIAEFMTNFVTKSGAKTVHIIAHSMGNRGVLRAVNRIAQRAQRRSGASFGQIILAAADVDASSFRQLSSAYQTVARKTTLYVSKRDHAVEASHWLHQFPRAGLMPPICIAPGIDTIGVTNVDVTLLGHGYVGDAREVLTDIHTLITTGLPPNQRFGLHEQRTDQGEQYWLIRA
jgi:esterase/lipase superfamily enzyme